MPTSARLPGVDSPLPDRRHLRKVLYRLGVGIPALAVGLVVPATAAWAGHTSSTHTASTHVSVSGHDSANCGDRHHPCRTITHAVDRAAPGGTVEVGPGVYHEQVVVPKELHLEGRHAVIDASGLQTGSGDTLNAAAVLLTKSAGGSSVEGFTVRGAYGEGILVLGATRVRITGTTVTGNDLGTPTTTKYAECQAQGEVPGDCGEGVHLMSASWSKVEDNVVTHNSGGILVTDEFGPAAGNWIVGNLSRDNAYDCGITLPSHNPDALSSTGARQPAKGGVYGNVVKDNTVVNNGNKGEGAGVLIAAAGPGMASYNNRVIGNRISGNEMAGVTVHSHAPNQDVSDNLIAGNAIGRNNLGGDPDAKVKATTGILVFSAVVHTTEKVRGNAIHGNQNPMWTSPNVTLH